MRTARVAAFVLASSLAACGGGGSSGDVPSALATPPPQPAGVAPTAAPPPVSADWATFQHDTQRSGYQSISPYTTGNASTLKLNWTFSDGVQFISSPIVYHDTVYVVDHNGQMTALDAVTGKIKWQQQLGLYVEQTPAIYDGKLFVGTHDIPSNLYAVDPATGAIIWKAILPGGLKSAPVAINGTLYEGVSLGDPTYCSPGGIYTVNENTGAAGALWLTESGTTADGGAVWSPISYDGTHLYFGTGNTCTGAAPSANAIVALDPSSLRTLWAQQTANPLTDDDVGTGVAIVGSQGVAAGKNGVLYNVDLSSGRINWQVPLGSPDQFGPVSIPTIVGSTILVSAGATHYVGWNDPDAPGALEAFSTLGTKMWTVSSLHAEVRSVAATNDLAFAAMDNAFIALNPTNGSALWSYVAQGDFAASPAITAQGIFDADLSGTVYAFALPNQLSTNARAIASRTLRPAMKGTTRFKFSRPVYCKPQSAAKQGS